MSSGYQHFSSLGVALVVSGPSGTGKTTICDKVLKERPSLTFSISCTTRTPREGEVDGKDYYFISVEEFNTRVEKGEFLEYAEVHGNYYGTLKSEVTERVKAGMDVLIDIDVQGMRQVRKASEGNDILTECCTYVFIAPPSYKELEKRLRNRATDDNSVVERRMLNARKELKAWNEYDYLIINDEVEKAADRLKAVMDADCIRTQRLQPHEEWPYV